VNSSAHAQLHMLTSKYAAVPVALNKIHANDMTKDHTSKCFDTSEIYQVFTHKYKLSIPPVFQPFCVKWAVHLPHDLCDL